VLVRAPLDEMDDGLLQHHHGLGHLVQIVVDLADQLAGLTER